MRGEVQQRQGSGDSLDLGMEKNQRKKEREDRNANGRRCPPGTQAGKPWTSESFSAEGLGNRIPKETGMGGGGVGLTIAEKL